MTTPRRPNDNLQEYAEIPFEVGAATADTTFYVKKFKRKFRVTGVQYLNITGLANDASNTFNLKLMNGSTVVANWNTLTGAEGALAAHVWVDMTLSTTDADLVFAADDIATLFADEGGDTTLPAGRIVIRGHYVD